MEEKATHIPPDDVHQAIMVRLLQEGDDSALRLMLSAYGPGITGYLARRFPRLAGHPEETDDILSMALFQIWKSRRVFDPTKSSLKRWFFLISDHVAIDTFKCPSAQSRLLESTNHDLDQVRCLVDDHDEVNREMNAESPAEKDIAEIFSGLSIIDQKIAIARSNFGGGGAAWAAELSGEIGLKAGTIRVRWSRIRQKMREEMERRGHRLEPHEELKARTLPRGPMPADSEGSNS